MLYFGLYVRLRRGSVVDYTTDESWAYREKYFSKRSEFLRFNLYFCNVILEFCLFSFCNTKISENSDMAFTLLTYPGEAQTSFELFAQKKWTKMELDAWMLKLIWR